MKCETCSIGRVHGLLVLFGVLQNCSSYITDCQHIGANKMTVSILL